jgi:predicted phage tail protein
MVDSSQGSQRISKICSISARRPAIRRNQRRITRASVCLICALQNRVTKASAYSSLPAEIHRLVRPVFFAGVFTGFFAAILVAIFLFGDFFAAVFFAAFFGGAFLGALLTGAFFANGSDAFLAGVSASVTEATAPPTAVLTEPATSSAIARPYPTFPAAFSNIVF